MASYLSMLSQDTVLNALKSVKYPGYSRDIISFGLVKDVAIDQGSVTVQMQLTSPNVEAALQIKAEAEAALKTLPGVTQALVEVRQPATGQPPMTLASPPWKLKPSFIWTLTAPHSATKNSFRSTKSTVAFGNRA